MQLFCDFVTYQNKELLGNNTFLLLQSNYIIHFIPSNKYKCEGLFEKYLEFEMEEWNIENLLRENGVGSVPNILHKYDLILSSYAISEGDLSIATKTIAN